MYPFQVIDCDPCINLGRLQRFMPQQLLVMSHWGTIFHHVSGTSVPECMGGDIFPDAGLLGMRFHYSPNTVRPHLIAKAV